MARILAVEVGKIKSVGQRGVRRFVGQVLLAGEEAQHRAALPGDVVADRPAPILA